MNQENLKKLAKAIVAVVTVQESHMRQAGRSWHLA